MNRYIYIIILSLLASEAEAQSAVADAPRLVVNISIDQLRSDYLETYISPSPGSLIAGIPASVTSAQLSPD